WRIQSKGVKRAMPVMSGSDRLACTICFCYIRWREGRRESMQQYRYLWWILDPTHQNHCEDCKRVAAGSPYEAPGSGGNELYQTCGDGRTHCGADCTCILSYSPPGPHNLDVMREPMTIERELYQYFTHGQVWYLQCHDELWEQVKSTTDRRK